MMQNFPQSKTVNPKHIKADEYKELCEKSRSALLNDNIGGWKVVDKAKDNNGFRATTYEKNGKYVITYEGTNILSAKDHAANIKMAVNGPSSQMKSAAEYYKHVMKNVARGENIDIAGHSEGGSEATYVGLINGKETYTYNAYRLGEKSRAKAEKESGGKYNESLINNYNDKNDPVSKMGENVGYTYIVPSPQNFFMRNAFLGFIPSHKLKNMGKCTDAIEKSLYKAAYPDFVDDISKVHITKEDMEAMPSDLFDFYTPIIDERLNSRQMTTDYDAHQMTLRGELIYVRPYQREDGTPVRGYYRRLA